MRKENFITQNHKEIILVLTPVQLLEFDPSDTSWFQPKNTTSLVARKVCVTALAAISCATSRCCKLSPWELLS